MCPRLLMCTMLLGRSCCCSFAPSQYLLQACGHAVFNGRNAFIIPYHSYTKRAFYLHKYAAWQHHIHNTHRNTRTHTHFKSSHTHVLVRIIYVVQRYMYAVQFRTLFSLLLLNTSRCITFTSDYSIERALYKGEWELDNTI